MYIVTGIRLVRELRGERCQGRDMRIPVVSQRLFKMTFASSNPIGPAAESHADWAPPGLPTHCLFKLTGWRAIPIGMTAEDTEEALRRLPPAELAKFRAWFAEFEAGRVNNKDEQRAGWAAWPVVRSRTSVNNCAGRRLATAAATASATLPARSRGK
jgi:hypothetical protein